MSSIFFRFSFILLYINFSFCNIMIQQVFDQLIEIINWVEATICSFEQNL